MKINRLIAVCLLLCVGVLTLAQVPSRPEPPRLVNDLAGVLGDTSELEDTLERFSQRTSNQICVVTVNDLGDYTASMLSLIHI